MLTLIIAVIFLLILFMLSLRGIKRSKARLYHSLVREDFNRSVRSLAMSHRNVYGGGAGASYKEIIEPLKKAVTNINQKMNRGEDVFEFEKWLFENFYLIDGAISRGAVQRLNDLPHVSNVPRIMSLARFIVDNSKQNLTIERITEAVEIYNSSTPLYFEELDFLKDALIIALAESLAELARKSLHYSNMKRYAERGSFNKKYSQSDSYILYFSQLNKTKEDKEDLYGRAEYGYARSLEQNRETAEYCITAIRVVSEGLNRTSIYDLSYIYQKMKKRSGLIDMDDESKYLIMNKIKTITAKTNVSEKYFCDIMLEIMKVNELDFATLLFDCERGVTRAMLRGKAEKLKVRGGECAEKLIIAFNALSAIVGGIMTAFGVFLAMSSQRTGNVLTFTAEKGVADTLLELIVAPFQRGLMAIGDYVFLGTIAVLFTLLLYPKLSHLFNLFFHTLLKKGYHFSMDFKEIAPEHSVLVAKAVFCSSIEDFKDSFSRLTELRTANSHANSYYSLLIDTPKSTEQEGEIDKQLIALFEKMKGQTDLHGVNLYLRKKTLIKDKYLPYERKRGAINALNAYLLGDKDEMLYVFDSSMPKPTFVTLLDDDNIVINDGILTLVNNMIHPYNSKFDLMAMKSKYNMYCQNSAYAKRYENSSGIERYPQYADTQFALTKKANYCGKGIYRLKSYAQKLEGKFRDNTVLSHDIIEGAMLHTGLAEVVAYEDSPQTLVSELERQKRWNRGDVLLLAFLGKKHRNKEGRRVKNKISSVYKDIIVKNNINLIEPLVSLSILILCVISGNMALIISLLYTLFIVQIVDILGVIRNSPKYLARFSLYRIYAIIKDRADDILLMPYYLILNVSIYFVTLYKYLFDREKLLEWKTFKASQKGAGYKKFFLTFLPSWIFLALFTGLFFTPAVLIYAILSIGRAHCLYSAGIKFTRAYVPSSAQKQLLLKVAKTTSDFIFEATDEKTALVSDNLQSYPKQEFYDKTSPTNIGFYIINIISSKNLGIITENVAYEKLNSIITTIEKLKKWRGCLYNWYNIRDLEPVTRFISSVDEGNLLASLITLHGYLKQESSDEQSLLKRVQKLIDQTEVSALYDTGRKLFYIGYNVENRKYEGHYDLFASESLILSYISILLSKVPVEHWFCLSRAATDQKGNTLLSWSGTMFEYLLPHIFFDVKKPTLLYKTAKNVSSVQRKKVFGGVYGISECAYGKLDNSLRYQYYAFGINELSLRNEQTTPIVSPYSSFLALPYDKKYYTNIEALMRVAYNNKYGFYDSVTMKHGGRNVICSHFSHHQGMIIASIANILTGNSIKKYFFAYEGQSATRLLLTEESDMRKVSRPIKLTNTAKSVDEEYSISKQLTRRGRHCNFHIGSSVNGVIDENGKGYFVTGGRFLNRYRFAENGYFGGFFYLSDDSGKLWSPTKAPLFNSDKYSIKFSRGVSEFVNESHKTTLVVEVAPHLKMIVKSLTVENESDVEKTIKLSYYEEVAMNGYAEDISHRSFQNLFVHTGYKQKENILYAVRKNIHSAGSLYYGLKVVGLDIVPECSRYNFLGRNGTEKAPSLLFGGEKTSPSLGDTLEPCLAFCGEITIAPLSKKEIVCAFCLADSLDDVIEMSRFAQDDAFVKNLAQLRKINAKFTDIPRITGEVSSIINKLFYLISSGGAQPRGSGENTLTYNTEGKIFLLDYYKTTAKDVENIISAFGIMQRLNAPIELFIIISENAEIGKSSEKVVKTLLNKYNCKARLTNKTEYLGSEVATLAYELSEIDYLLIGGGEGSPILAKDIDALQNISDNEVLEALKTNGVEIRENEAMATGEGRYLDGANYTVEPFKNSPYLPYSNVCARGEGGYLTTENGGGYTFFKNSQLGKVTEWYNDPVKDTKSEDVFIIIDGKVLPISESNGGKTRVTHGLYSTYFLSKTDKLTAELAYTITPKGYEKQIRVTIKNNSDKEINLKLCLSFFLSLGKYKSFYYTKKDEGDRAYICNATQKVDAYLACKEYKIYKNYDELKARATEYSSCACAAAAIGRMKDRVASCEVNEEQDTHIECENISQNKKMPHTFLFNKFALYNEEGERRYSGAPPCADNFIGVDCPVSLKPSETGEWIFAIQTIDKESITTQVEDNLSIDNDIKMPELEVVNKGVREAGVYIKTPILSLDIMFNYRLPYQIKSSRLSGRLGYYQAGGATGFRDQLQDCLALLYSDPKFVRTHILKCCAHQYLEGDVQHWWHEERLGVRTRISDDRLFLAYVTAKYITASGDNDILLESVDFLISKPLDDTEKARMETPETGKEGSVYEHIRRAIDCSLRYGDNDLLLIGSGDWNDALDDIGDSRHGESVWLTAFCYLAISEFSPYTKKEDVKRWTSELLRLKKGANGAGYNGKYFNRAITKEGEILGSPDSKYCKIDLITQATAVMAKISEREKLESAMVSAEDLVDRENKLVKLLSPPFDEEKYYGYISSYPRGVRENGGQYTHGVAWYIIALAELNYKSRALDIFNMINPTDKCADAHITKKYKGEPYAFSADVYSGEGNEGRCGWSFYTGSASWLYRAIIENILGVKLVRNCLEFDFLLPKSLDVCEVLYKTKTAEYRIKLIISDKKGLFVNGVEYVGDNKINLADGEIIREVLVKCIAS